MPAPVNDLFANRIAISAVGTYSGTTLDATSDVNDPYGSPARSVWYDFSGLADGFYSITFDDPTAVITNHATLWVGPPYGQSSPVATPPPYAWAYFQFVSFGSGGTPATAYFVKGAEDLWLEVFSYGAVTPNGEAFSFDLAVAYTPPYDVAGGPPYDNIDEAFDLIQDGETHTAEFSNVGATFQTNEETYAIAGWPGVWARARIDKYRGPIDVALTIERLTGTVVPYVASMVDTLPFDVTIPDFQNGSFADIDLGDGTAGPVTDTFNLDPTDYNLSAGSDGYIYLFFTDYDGAIGQEGTMRLTYSFPPLPPDPVCIDAIDVANIDSPTITVLGDAVRDSQTWLGDTDGTEAYFNLFPDGCNPTLLISGADLPPNGLYQVRATVRIPSYVSADQNTIFGITRNGVPLWPPNFGTLTNAGPTEVQLTYIKSFYPTSGAWGEGNNWPIDATIDDILITGAADIVPWLPITETDEIGIWAINSTGHTHNVEILEVCFQALQLGGSNGAPYSLLDISDTSLGYPLISQGLQETANQVVSCNDVCVTNDGHVWVLWCENIDSTHFKGPHFAEFNGTSWTVHSNDLSGFGSVLYNSGNNAITNACSIDTDGTNLYLCWVEYDGTTFTRLNNGTVLQNYHIRVKKYSPSGASYTDMGGFRSSEPTTYDNAVLEGYSRGAPRIRVGPTGDIYVGFCQAVDYEPGQGSTQNLPYVFKWAGSTSWTDIALPLPAGYVNMHSVAETIIQAESISNGTGTESTGSFDPPGAAPANNCLRDTQTINPSSPSGATFTTTTMTAPSSGGNHSLICNFIAEGGSSGNIVIVVYVNGVATQTTNYNPGTSGWNQIFICTQNIPNSASVQVKAGKSSAVTGRTAIEIDWFRFVKSRYDASEQVGEVDATLVAGFEVLTNVDLTFCHHDGPSDTPSAIYTAEVVDQTVSEFAGGGGTGNRAHHKAYYAEYDGASWDNELVFFLEDVAFDGTRQLFNDYRHGSFVTRGHWCQGISLANNGIVPYVLWHSGFGGSATDSMVVIRLKEDGSAFECFTRFPPSQLGSEWSAEDCHGIAFDSEGRLYVALGTEIWDERMIIQQVDIGNGGWIVTAKVNNPVIAPTSDRYGALVAHGTSIYLVDAAIKPTYEQLSVWKFDLLPDQGFVWSLSQLGAISLNKIRYRAFAHQ